MSKWNKKTSKWSFYGNSEKYPYTVEFEVISGQDRSSLEIATEWDDTAEENFYYRDYTKSTLPFVKKKEKYRTCFFFQSSEEAEKFRGQFSK